MKTKTIIPKIVIVQFKKIFENFIKACINQVFEEVNQKSLIDLLESEKDNIKTDINGKIFLKLEDTVLFVFDLKQETVEVFINRVSYVKRLMSLKVLKYSWLLWCSKQMFNIKDKNLFKTTGETNTYIRNNTPIKYIIELREIINTKNIFT